MNTLNPGILLTVGVLSNYEVDSSRDGPHKPRTRWGWLDVFRAESFGLRA